MHQIDTGAGAEFIAIIIGEQKCGLDILKVQEIRRHEAVTTLAKARAYFKGVANLRGVMVPIIDMRIRFNLWPPNYDQFTIVLVRNLRRCILSKRCNDRCCANRICRIGEPRGYI